jgi:formate dehydrogenase major subunit
MSTATIDGRPVITSGHETILEAARRAGVAIPTLCYSADLDAEGGCRVCLVEKADGGLVAACHTPIADGMKLATDSARLRALRRQILSLLLSEHPAGRFRPDPHGSRLERLMAELAIDRSDLGHHGIATPVDHTHPYIRFDRDLCITCRLCLNTCEQVQGQFVYGIAHRGARTSLHFGPTARFVDSPCTACGACVDRCPTGAVTDRDRRNGRSATAITESVCGYCGVGCRVRIEADTERVLRIAGVDEASVNRGHLCAKGRYAHSYQSHGDRLLEPLLRRGSELQPVSWDDAISWLARRLRDVRDAYGGDALGAITSSRSTNEACYLLQKLFRTAIGTNNIDCCARVCHSSTAVAMAHVTGIGAATASYADIEAAERIVVVGANPTEAHPVIGARIKQARLRGAALVAIDPRRIELADYADVHLAPRPGTNVALFNALAHLLINRGSVDLSYISERTDGFEPLREFLDGMSFDQAVTACGVEAAAVNRVASILGLGPTLFVHGLGLSEQSQGTAAVMALCNLALLTGSIGQRGAGMLPLRGQNNVQGNADMGAVPDALPGYQAVGDDDVRRHFARLWGKAPPRRPGLTLPEMIDAAGRGAIRALWVQGEDIAQSESGQDRVIAALQRLDLLVVQDLFLCETARYAHLVLPAAGALEQDGTFTNAERRIQRVRSAVHPPGHARPDAEVIAAVAQALGEKWDDYSPAGIMDEIARAAPKLWGGVSYDRLDDDGLQWPCPTREHPGTETLHATGFARGRGRLTAVRYEPAPEAVDAEFPLLLITGRVLQHYNVGTMTRRTPSAALAASDFLEIHPADAEPRHLSDRQVAEVSSRWGTVRVLVQRSTRVAAGNVFLSFHDPASHTNRLIGPHRDPQSKCPDYKVTAVQVRAAADSATHRLSPHARNS